MRILLTGASGFIGQHCLKILCEQGHEVHAFGRNVKNTSTSVTWHQLDMRDFSVVADVMQSVKPTHLLHLAWYTAAKGYWTAAENLQWVAISLELLRHFVANGGQRVVHAGSCAEYAWQHAMYHETDTPRTPSTLYGRTKSDLNKLTDFYAAQEDFSFAVARIFFLYGPHEAPTRLVASVIRALLANTTAPCSPGLQQRDFLHVEDAAQAMVQLLLSDVRHAVNIGSGKAVAVHDIADMIGEILGKNELLDFTAYPPPEHEPAVICADNTRLVKEVGWSPKYDLETGLQQTIGWWRDNQ